MARRSFLEGVQPADSLVDSCSSSTFGWLSPRISFSKDFAPHGDGGTQHSYERREMIAKESNSEFEFSKSSVKDGNLNTGVMLPADELFHKGQIVPKYISQHAEESLQQSSQEHEETKESAHVSSNRKKDQEPVGSIVKSSPSASIVVVDQYPESSRPTKCSIGWRALFRLRKSQAQRNRGRICTEARQRQRTESKNKPPPLPLKPVETFPSSTGAKAQHAFSSPEEPLLAPPVAQPDAVLLHSSIPIQSQAASSDGVSTSHDLCTFIPSISAPSSSEFLSSPPEPESASGDCSDDNPAESLREFVDRDDEAPLREFVDRDDEASLREYLDRDDEASLANWNLQNIDTLDTGARVRRSCSCQERASSATTSVRSGETIPGRNSRKSSPRRRSGSVTSCKSNGRLSPGRPSIGADAVGSPRSSILGRNVVRNLQGSSNSSQIIQKNQDQLKATRQKDGWRGLERSTSYCATVRVTPVLNVPVYFSPSLRAGSPRRSRKVILGFGQLYDSKEVNHSKAHFTAT